jgi:hypothetical protein
VDEPAQEDVGGRIDYFLLPILQGNRSLVLAIRAVLGEQALPVDGMAYHIRAATGLSQ